MSIRPYLAGAISGISREEATAWREEVKKLWPDAIDPTRRKLGEPWLIDELVIFDKADIQKSTFVLVRWNNTWPVSCGTSMEVMYAHTLNKPIFIWKDEGWILPPWLEYHVWGKFNSLELLYDCSRHFGLPVR